MIRHNILGALNRLLVEWTSEDRDMYKNNLRMSREHFFELLSKVKSYIQKQDTNMRECVSAHAKLQIARYTLGNGSCLACLHG